MWHDFLVVPYARTMSLTMTVKLGKQGRLVIPAELRRAIGIEGEDDLVVWVEGDALKIQRRVDFETALWDELADDEWTVDGFVAERRAEAAREWGDAGEGGSS